MYHLDWISSLINGRNSCNFVTFFPNQYIMSTFEIYSIFKIYLRIFQSYSCVPTKRETKGKDSSNTLKCWDFWMLLFFSDFFFSYWSLIRKKNSRFVGTRNANFCRQTELGDVHNIICFVFLISHSPSKNNYKSNKTLENSK